MSNPAIPCPDAEAKCPACGGALAYDATARFNAARGYWELTGVHDTASCDDCDWYGDTDLIENGENQ